MIRKWILYSDLTINNRTYNFKRIWYFENPVNKTEQPSEWIDDVLEMVLRYKHGTFVDVGVNMGQTLMKVLSIDAKRDYVGFEPNLKCSFYVEQFIKDNGLKHHKILPVGLGEKSGVAKLLMREGDTFSASTIENFRPDDFYSYCQYIYVAEGDFVLTHLGVSSISLIKIDVEGGELEVIRGLINSIRNHNPFIIFEVLPHYLAITGKALDKETVKFRTKRIKQLEKILFDADYSLYQIQPHRVLKKINMIEPEEKPDLSKSDYVAIPPNEANNFITFFASV